VRQRDARLPQTITRCQQQCAVRTPQQQLLFRTTDALRDCASPSGQILQIDTVGREFVLSSQRIPSNPEPELVTRKAIIAEQDN
jgi:hypothetical protein